MKSVWWRERTFQRQQRRQYFIKTLLLDELGSVAILDSLIGFQSRGKEHTNLSSSPDTLCNFYFVWPRKHTFSQSLKSIINPIY